jgi:hypothetical protein
MMPACRMTPYQMASLLDAAFRSLHPLTFLDTAALTFRMIGREADNVSTAWIGCLYAEGEMELLMSLRAAWERGEERCPRKVAKHAAWHST